MPFLLLIVLSLITAPVLAEAPRVDPKTDAEHLGRAEEILFWKGETKVASFRNMDKIYPTRLIESGDNVYSLDEAPKDFSNFSYEFQGKPRSIDEFITIANNVGLLVIKDGKILLERYSAGNTEDSLWVSFSVSKSVTSMLLGAAIQDGYIDNVDEKVSDYLPRLKGTSYEQVSIKNILNMASGTEWNEDYADPKSDVNNTPGGMVNLIGYLGDKKRVAPAGDKFNYNTGETNLVGALVRAAVGNNLATYLTDKIWLPFGMESDANWALEGFRQGELGGCCISATLRDYGRIGLFAMTGGQLSDGTAILPKGWMAQSIAPSKGDQGYGYLWWLFDQDVFAALGVFGQSIFVDSKHNIVIVTQSAWDNAVGEADAENRAAFIAAMLSSLREQ